MLYKLVHAMHITIILFVYLISFPFLSLCYAYVIYVLYYTTVP